MGETIFPPAFLSFVLDPEGASLGEAAPRDENNQAMLILCRVEALSGRSAIGILGLVKRYGQERTL
jgi:hypothetical protein